jgi:hypothetical protein
MLSQEQFLQRCCLDCGIAPRKRGELQELVTVCVTYSYVHRSGWSLVWWSPRPIFPESFLFPPLDRERLQMRRSIDRSNNELHASRGNVVFGWEVQLMKLPEGNPSQFRECGDRVMLAESNPQVSLKSSQLRIGDEQDRPDHTLPENLPFPCAQRLPWVDTRH